MSNNLPSKQEKYSVPKLEDIYSDVDLAGRINDLNKLLNAKPKKEWIKQHPIAKKIIIDAGGNKQEVPVDFIPIERIEYLLTAIYLKWRKEIKSVQTIANSIVVVMRLWVLDPVSGEWDWQEGVGAAPIRTKKGAAATDFSQVQDSSVQTGAPAAASYALKDAAEAFGTLFGANINRREDLDYAPMQQAKSNNLGPVPEELAAVIDEISDLEGYENIWNNNPQFHANRDFITRMKVRRQAIAEKEVPHE